MNSCQKIGFVFLFSQLFIYCTGNPVPPDCTSTDDQTLITKKCLANQTTQNFYKFTESGETRETPLPSTFQVPVLNQNIASIDSRIQSGDDSSWNQKFVNMASNMNGVYNDMKQEAGYENLELNTDSKHLQFFNDFQQKVKSREDQYFQHPALDSTKYVNKINSAKAYQSDQAFVQRRLAGQCPFTLRKVTRDGNTGMNYDDLKNKMKTGYSFDDLIKTALHNDTVGADEAVDQGKLFILYHESYEGISSDNLVVQGETSEDVGSPISFFVKDNSEIQVIAIQDKADSSSSTVYTPNQGENWNRMKTVVEMVDQAVCKAYYSVGKVHFVSSIFCISFRRYFGTLHPLYQVMEYHCKGTVPTVAKAYTTMFQSGREFDLFTPGVNGMKTLAEKGYRDFPYNKLDASKALERAGTNNIGLTYFPYHEDSTQIFTILDELAVDLVNALYTTDLEVANDRVLRKFTTLMNTKISGFPATFTTKQQLVECISKFFGLLVEQCVTTYASGTFGSCIPRSPPRMFRRTNNDVLENSFPKKDQTLATMKLNSIVSGFRNQQLFGHRSGLTGAVKTAVDNAWQKLQTHKNNQINKDNQRKAAGKLSIPELNVDSLVNSVSV